MSAGVRLVEAAIGETREVVIADGRLQSLRVRRWSDEGRRAQAGERYVGRVRAIDRRRRGAFVDVGLSEEEGFLRCDGAGRVVLGAGVHALVEGEAIEVEVRREGARNKGPVLAAASLASPGAPPQRVARPDEMTGAAPDCETRDLIEAGVDGALAREVPVPGGGRLMIEPTAALVAIDVDAGARGGPADPEKFALELNLAAADECARQLRLRSLGGVIAIDFVSMRSRQNQLALTQHVRAALAGEGGAVVAPLSRFGVLELSRAQILRPLHEIMLTAEGAATPETEALRCLRAMEREARAARGRVVRATVTAPVHAWLGAELVPWRQALTERVGARWDIVAGEVRARPWEVVLV